MAHPLSRPLPPPGAEQAKLSFVIDRDRDPLLWRYLMEQAHHNMSRTLRTLLQQGVEQTVLRQHLGPSGGE